MFFSVHCQNLTFLIVNIEVDLSITFRSIWNELWEKMRMFISIYVFQYFYMRNEREREREKDEKTYFGTYFE